MPQARLRIALADFRRQPGQAVPRTRHGGPSAANRRGLRASGGSVSRGTGTGLTDDRPDRSHRGPPAPSGKGAPAGHAGPAQAGLDPRARAGDQGLCRDRGDRARERPAHGVRGGRLPQHRRVLGAEARHLHDPGRHLHARLRVLQRQDRDAGTARSARAAPRRGGDRRSSGSRISSSPRSIATTSPTAARSISRKRSAPSASCARQPPSKC